MRFAYSARVVPIGTPARVRGDCGQPVTFTFDKFNFSASRSVVRDLPVLLNHDHTMRIGNLRSLNPNLEWWVCEFELDDALGIEFDPGQSVSVGLKWIDKYASAPSVEELSIVRRGRIPGAEITSRCVLPPAARVQPGEAAGNEVFYGGVIRRPGIGQVLGVR